MCVIFSLRRKIFEIETPSISLPCERKRIDEVGYLNTSPRVLVITPLFVHIIIVATHQNLAYMPMMTQVSVCTMHYAALPSHYKKDSIFVVQLHYYGDGR